MKYPPETRPKYLIKAAHYRPLHGNSTRPANTWGIGDSGVRGVGFGRHLGRRKGQKTPVLQKKEVLYPLRPRGYRTFDLVDILVDRGGRRRGRVNNGWAGYAQKIHMQKTAKGQLCSCPLAVCQKRERRENLDAIIIPARCFYVNPIVKTFTICLHIVHDRLLTFSRICCILSKLTIRILNDLRKE